MLLSRSLPLARRCLCRLSIEHSSQRHYSASSASAPQPHHSLSGAATPSASIRREAAAMEPEAYDIAERRRWVLGNIAQALEDSTAALFAVIYIHGKQFKVIQDDLIHLEHNIPLDIGDEINLEKILLVGGAEFTLIGRPLLDPKTVHVRATVVEKTTTSPEVKYDFRVQNALNPLWLSHELTVLRINNISVEKAALGEP